ncbi:YiiX/YebB-like N1pC/P60 family cysteine hydrolase [Thermodesulforhabdus norvegica]|uniref:Permuted papain-like amidase enzyme, YaeF/YiiX, C92 family n=1 Tax=Thermodesulforhabdus norvegica TaxID=39841 RepID=A0A1I4U889_9BACT|nr:YiiX/YebB-like N1pC/P60 family cysteine hydrolase [Thermodesulforhabdus norvegica]SFM85060.1 hypothetical protein SAMN05660836_01693 [Thermodesulforhabdus norvegica]
MAEKQIARLPYYTARPHIKTGDAILWKGNGLISRLIRLWTPFSHASLVLRFKRHDTLQDRVFLVEALTSGLELRLLSKRLEHYNGRAYWFHIDVDEKAESAIIDYALTMCASGIPYDYGSLIKNIFGRVSADATRFFCSEFVFNTWVEAGILSMPPSGKAPRPGDIPKWVRGILTELEWHPEPE